MLALFNEVEEEDEVAAFGEEDLTDLASGTQLSTADPRLAKLTKTVAKQTNEALHKIGKKIMKKELSKLGL